MAAVFWIIYVGFSLYGFITDIAHNHFGWVLLEVLTGSGIAFIRGVLFFLGVLAY